MGSQLIIPMIACTLGWLAGFAVLGRLRRCILSHTGDREECPSVSIIIPARNEEHRLEKLLRSLQLQKMQSLEMIVVDDGSTDRTAAIARELGATVLTSAPLPDGWRGKTWACQQGANAASADLLLFVDADVWFHPAALQSILQTYQSNPGALSILPYHVVHKLYEQLSAVFNLVMAGGIGAFTWPARVPDGLFGQMLLVDKSSYAAAGGHAAVRGKILENLWMATYFKKMNVPISCRIGADVCSMQMYPVGFRDLCSGWSKAFATGAAATALPVLLAIIIWLSAAISTASLLIRFPGVPTATLYCFFVIQIFILLRNLGSYRFYTAIFYPVPLLFFFLIFGRSILNRRRGVSWKGRVIHAD